MIQHNTTNIKSPIVLKSGKNIEPKHQISHCTKEWKKKNQNFTCTHTNLTRIDQSLTRTHTNMTRIDQSLTRTHTNLTRIHPLT